MFQPSNSKLWIVAAGSTEISLNGKWFLSCVESYMYMYKEQYWKMRNVYAIIL